MQKGELQCRNGSGSGTTTDANKKNEKKTDSNDNKEASIEVQRGTYSGCCMQ